MHNIPTLDRDILIKNLPFQQLIPALETAFQQEYTIPQRHHHDFANSKEGIDSTLLLMPAWRDGDYLGVKVVTVSPNNGKYDLPSIQGIYILLDAHKGMPLAYMEAKTLTARRTAAASALASSFLSRKDSRSLLMVGTGALAPELIRAHSTVRPIEKVFIWGRNFSKAQALQATLAKENITIQAVERIEDVIEKVDIISCATLSEKPLIFGKWLKAGQHVDLVGAYKPNMREADDEVIRRSNIFLDVMDGGTRENGDILIPLKTGVLKREEIKGDLFNLCRKEIAGRTSEEVITCFKSVGYALEDLAGAKLAYKTFLAKD
jgi:ornithine cyclodeaminase